MSNIQSITVCYENGMRHFTLAFTKSTGIQAPKKLLPDIHPTDYSLVRRLINTQWKSGTIL